MTPHEGLHAAAHARCAAATGAGLMAIEQAPVTLANCADEPIHVPGAIQPHGALLVLRDGALVAWSDNAAQWLHCRCAPGLRWPELGLPLPVMQAGEQLLAEAAEQEGLASAAAVTVAGEVFDLVVHQHAGRTLLEFEHRAAADDQVSAFALMAHRAIERLKKAPDIDSLLSRLVTEVHHLTGFDRVMAYRFRHDQSGDVVAEAARADLAPYLGRRYPASDIPAQARRLYVLNSLRLIADVGYRPVPLVGQAGDPPLDLTHAVLRSVSPIHVEYLQNMGVGASMSVSIVVAGELWGMVACHHMSPRQVPHSVRMSCDVLAQVVSVSVQTLQAREQAGRRADAASLIATLAADVSHADDLLLALLPQADAMRRLFDAEAAVLTQGPRLRIVGERAPGAALAQAMLDALGSRSNTVLALDDLASWPEALQHRIDGWVGALLLPVDQISQCRVMLLRREQVQVVRWGGQPEKQVRIGPLGPRLTPRGSFDEWREIVRGRCVPWDALAIHTATELFNQVQRASLVRHAETESARQQLLAMLGHDLRDPLQAIHMVAGLMRQDDHAPRLATRLETSSRRMQRLITQVLDFSRVDAGLQLASVREPVDLVALVEDLAEESRLGHPDVPVALDLGVSGPARVLGDGGRLAQLVGNLLSNARHHGRHGEPVEVHLAAITGASGAPAWQLSVRNAAPPIDPDAVPTLFQAHRQRPEASARNRDGLGLGLYIGARIAAEHGAELGYRYEDPHVVFMLRIPALAG